MSASQPIDVRDMAIVHRPFRTAYKESAQLVRPAPSPSPGRGDVPGRSHRPGLGGAAFDAAFVRGRAMTIGEGVAFAVADEPAHKPAPPVRSAPDTALTPRQLEIARLIADDLTNRQIADRLFLSERTVETHMTNILNKLGLNSRIQLSRWIAELPKSARS
jgi:DNA-binding CsgD family transcriptional regulator